MALRTPGTARSMSASSHSPMSRFQPGSAVRYARTGAAPSPLAICGLPPERRTGFFFPAAGFFFELAFAFELAANLAFFAPAFAAVFDLAAGLAFFAPAFAAVFDLAAGLAVFAAVFAAAFGLATGLAFFAPAL